MNQMTRAAAILGRKGGKAATDIKRASSRLNGAKGGRPRKLDAIEEQAAREEYLRQNGGQMPSKASGKMLLKYFVDACKRSSDELGPRD
jgi:hypothetical protein